MLASSWDAGCGGAIRAEIGAGHVHTQADTVLSAFIDEIIRAVREAELPPAGAARP